VTLLKAVEQSRTRAIDSLIKELANLSAGLPREAGQKKIDTAHEEDAPPLPPAPRLTEIPPPAPPPPAVPAPPPAEETGPSPDLGKTYSAFDDSPPMETLEDSAAEYDATRDSGGEAEDGAAPQSANTPTVKETLPAAYPGSEDFAAALATIPPALTELLDKEFRATFTALIPVAKEKILH
jgi:hypothetical protein